MSVNDLWLSVLAQSIEDDLDGCHDAREWLTSGKHAASRQLVCDWADVSEDVLRLYVARRLQSGLSMSGLDRKALRDLASPDDPQRSSCACCGDPLEGQSTKFCGKKCRQKQWLRDKAAAKRAAAG